MTDADTNGNGNGGRHGNASGNSDTSPTHSSSQLVDLDQLTLFCGTLVARAGERIRAVHQKRLSGKSIGVQYKTDDIRSALTEADQDAQAAIVPALRIAFPSIAIVGEEESDDEGEPEDVPDISDSLNGNTPTLGLGTASCDAVSVFVDPVDATLEFVQGNLPAVQTLAGVCVHGRPIASAISQPFAPNAPVVLVSVPLKIRHGVENVLKLSDRTEEGVIAAVSKRPKGLIADVLDIISPAKIVELGGAGNKLMRIATGEADIVVLNLVTSLWDTAATEALVRASGGDVTDFFGVPLPHAPGSRLSNRYGVIATSCNFTTKDKKGRSHRELCADVRESMCADSLLEDSGIFLKDSIPQATDITRNLDGNPITLEFLQKTISKHITAFSAPESSAVRYLMSDACRIELKYSTENGEESNSTAPQSVFFKRVVMADLPHVQLKMKTAPQKLARDVTSYQVEADFLNSADVARFVDTGANIARPYHVEIRKGTPVIQSKFALILEDFSPKDGWKQYGLLDEGQTKAALRSLSELHAYFWNTQELGDQVWKQASYWAPERQPLECFEKIESCWTTQYDSFGAQLKELEDGESGKGVFPLKELGRVLQKYARDTAEKVHAVGLDLKHPHRTICHGDGKAANFFFRTKGDSDSGIEVGNIDFQWTGFAHPALDIAYLIWTSAQPDLLSRDKELLQYYMGCLRENFIKYGKAADKSAAEGLLGEEEFTRFYEDALIDLARLVISYHWDRIDASPQVLESRKDKLGSNSYNKNVECAMQLVKKSWNILGRWESGAKE